MRYKESDLQTGSLTALVSLIKIADELRFLFGLVNEMRRRSASGSWKAASTCINELSVSFPSLSLFLSLASFVRHETHR